MLELKAPWPMSVISETYNRGHNIFELLDILGIPEFLGSGRKSSTLDFERWTLDAGLWTLDAGLWTLDAALWTLDAAICTLDSGHWILDTGHCRWLL